MVNLTGGTAAPSIRVNAAARVLGAPRAVGQRAQRPTGGTPPRLPRARGGGGATQQRGISQSQTAPQHAAKPIAQHPAARAQARPAPAFNPLQGNLSSSQLAALASSITQESAQTQLKPLGEESKQITGAEGTAQARLAGMAQTGQQVQQGLQQGLEASAKTGENNAADAALSASKAIETSGQSAQTANAGYVDPAVRAALANAQNETAAFGGAAGQFQTAMGVSGQGLMANLRAAAAQRVTEGAGRLAQDYGAAQGRVGSEESRVLAKRPADAKSLAVELGQKQFTDAATLKSLGIKQGQLGVNAAKAATERTIKGKEVGVKQQKLGIERERNRDSILKEEMKVRGDLEKQGLANAGALAREQVKAKTSLETANKKAGRLTTSEEDKAIGELSNTFTSIRSLVAKGAVPKGIAGSTKLREILTQGERPVAREVEGKTKISKEKVATARNGVLITAGIEAWYYHKVSTVTQAQLKKMGIQSVPRVQNGELTF